MKRVTRKMRLASEILGDEWCADDPDFVVNLYRNGKATPKQIYIAMRHFGYRWHNGKWTLTYPGWLKNAISRRDREIVKSWRVTYV